MGSEGKRLACDIKTKTKRIAQRSKSGGEASKEEDRTKKKKKGKRG